jgi:hypothetical protein
MGRTYKYLTILTFILNFTNIYSQSDNLISIWSDKAMHTLYLDKKLLESAANALSQYLGPLAPIILENLPYIISFFALFFIFRRFLNIINENLRMKDGLSALMAAIGTYFFWPFVIPILIVALIIKAFRVGISKLESLKANLSKINSRLAHLFSKTVSDFNNFNKNVDITLKDINKLDKMPVHPQIKRLIYPIKKDIEALRNIVSSCLSEGIENENLTLRTLSFCSSKFNEISHNAKIKIRQLASILNNPVSFKSNKFTQKNLRELINIVRDLNMRLEKEVCEEGQKIFGDLHGLLTSAENISREIERGMERELNVIKEDIKKTPLQLRHNEKEKIEKNIQNLQIEVRNINNKELSPLKKLEIINRMRKSIKKAYIDAEKLRKGLIRSPKSSVKEAKEIEGALKSALKAGAQGAAMKGSNAPGAAIRLIPGPAARGGNAPGAAIRLIPGPAARGGNAPGAAGKILPSTAPRSAPSTAIRPVPVAPLRGGSTRGVAGKR